MPFAGVAYDLVSRPTPSVQNLEKFGVHSRAGRMAGSGSFDFDGAKNPKAIR